MDFKPEFWERNANSELISQSFNITVANDEITKYIENSLENAKNETDETKKEVFKKVAELLQNEYESTKIELSLELIPLVSGELRCIIKGDKFDINGDITTDQEASICAAKCKVPKYTFEQWRDMKDFRVKKAIASKIREISLPKQSEKVKEVFQMLRGL
jgi:hypothetical protein